MCFSCWCSCRLHRHRHQHRCDLLSENGLKNTLSNWTSAGNILCVFMWILHRLPTNSQTRSLNGKVIRCVHVNKRWKDKHRCDDLILFYCVKCCFILFTCSSIWAATVVAYVYLMQHSSPNQSESFTHSLLFARLIFDTRKFSFGKYSLFVSLSCLVRVLDEREREFVLTEMLRVYGCVYVQPVKTGNTHLATMFSECSNVSTLPGYFFLSLFLYISFVATTITIAMLRIYYLPIIKIHVHKIIYTYI